MDDNATAPTPATRREVDLSSARVSYLEWSPTDPKRTVLLLHGGGVDSASLSWGEAGPVLAASGYRVLAPDHPGYGESPLPAWPSSQENLVAYVGEFADALGLDGYVVGGLSLGGGMTLGHLLAHPSGVAGGLLLGSYGLMDRMTDGPLSGVVHWLTWASLHSGLLDVFTRFYWGKRSRMEANFGAVIRDPDRRPPELLDEVWEAGHRPDGMTAFGQWQRSEFGSSRARTNYTSRLAQVTVPVLLVHGEFDVGVPIARAREAVGLLPNARLVEVPGAGHWVQRERPDLVLPAVLEFLAGLD